jgi:hypothetical protein
MKNIIALFCVMYCCYSALSQTGSIGIGTISPNNSAALEIASSTKGVLIPRMNTTQRNAIPSPATGLMVYDNTTNSFWFKSTTDWVELSDTANNVWRKNGTNAYVNVPDNVGIGTNTPQYHLDINKPNASIGLTDAQSNQFSGSITGNAGNLNIIASRALIGGNPGHLILQNNSGFAVAGNVGIGTTTPLYKLDVSGDSRINGSHTVNVDVNIHRDLWVDRNLDVDGTTNLFGNITAGSNLAVSGNLTVDAGKGIVRGNNSLQLVVVFPSGTLQFTNAPPGHTQDVAFALPNAFSSTPLISVAQVLNPSGNFEHWTATIHAIDIVNHQFTVRFYNAGNTNSTMAGTYRFIAIGAAL